jgi:uncharacterized repeat protein (TIGR02543 family)
MKFLAKSITVLILLITVIACGDNLKPNGTTPNTTAATYTVTFSSQFNNTESTTTMPNPTSITVNPGEPVGTLPSEPTMSGYKFGGWWTGKGGTGIHFTASTKVTSDIIVYAYWYKYEVTYMSDNTTVIAITMITTPTIEALPTPPTKTGYTFVGWNTAANGSGMEFMANTDVTSMVDPTTKSLTVYAKWFQNTTPLTPIYAVTYDSDGGNAVGTQYVVSPAANVVTLPADPTKLFSVFAHWWTAKNGGGTQFFADTTVGANITVYANWTATPGYTVTYNSGWGGTAVETQYVITPATTVGALPADPTKPCYTFAHWWTGKGDTATEFKTDTDVTSIADPTTKILTIYAKWTYVGFTPSYPAPSTYTIGGPGPSCIGKVFYIEAGSNNMHGLEAAPPGWSDPYAENGDPSATWIYGDTTDDGNGGTYQKTQTILNGNTLTGIGTYSAPTGLANSKAIIKQAGTTPPYAAQLCQDYHEGGLNDWFLPSKDELAQLYAQKDVQRWGGFVEERYWSSSEYDANDGWSQYFTTGAQQGTYKSYEMLVRPVRAF